MSTHSRGQCGHAVVARVPGRPGIGGRTNRAARVSSARTHTHTRRHSLRPRRSLCRLSSLSPPFVLVTAIRPSCVAHPAVCSVAMLPYLLFVDACSTDDPVPALPPWPSAWNCTCTAPMTDGLKLPGCTPRRRGRTGVRPCAALRSHLLPPPGQSTGGKKKVNVDKGSFFYLVLRHWNTHTGWPRTKPRRGRWSSARLCS